LIVLNEFIFRRPTTIALEKIGATGKTLRVFTRLHANVGMNIEFESVLE
jgi:hypothetical protein